MKVLDLRNSGSNRLTSVKSRRQQAMEANFKALVEQLVRTDVKDEAEVQRLLASAVQAGHFPSEYS